LGSGSGCRKNKKQKEIGDVGAVQSTDQVGYPPRNRNRERQLPLFEYPSHRGFVHGLFALSRGVWRGLVGIR
jgi:hypothetical protein